MKKRITAIFAAAVTALSAAPVSAGAIAQSVLQDSQALNDLLADYTKIDRHDGNDDPTGGLFAHKYWTDRYMELTPHDPYIVLYYMDGADKTALNGVINSYFPESRVHYFEYPSVPSDEPGIGNEWECQFSIKKSELDGLESRLRSMCEEANEVCEVVRCMYNHATYGISDLYLYSETHSIMDYRLKPEGIEKLKSYVEEKDLDVTVKLHGEDMIRLIPNGVFTRQEEYDLAQQIRNDTGIVCNMISPAEANSVGGDPLEIGTNVEGDANCDRILSIADATAILQAIGNPDQYALTAQGAFNGDIYGNDGITGMDALEIMRRDAKLPPNSIDAAAVPAAFKMAAEPAEKKADKRETGELTGYWSAADKYGARRFIGDFNGIEYEINEEKAVPEKYLGEVIGEAVVESPCNVVYAIFDGEETDDTTYVMAEPDHISEVREIKGISPKIIIAVKYDIGDGYILFTNKNYMADSLEEYAGDLGLGLYAQPYELTSRISRTEYYSYEGVTLDFLFDNLINDSQFTDKTIAKADSYSTTIHICMNYPEDMGFSPCLNISRSGYAYFHIPNVTNAADIRVGDANVKAFMEKVDEEFPCTVKNY